MEALHSLRDSPVDNEQFINMLISNTDDKVVGSAFVKYGFDDMGNCSAVRIENMDYVAVVRILCSGNDVSIFKKDFTKLECMYQFSAYFDVKHIPIFWTLEKCNLTIGELISPVQKSLFEKMLDSNEFMSSDKFANIIDCFIMYGGENLFPSQDDYGLQINLHKFCKANWWPTIIGYISNGKYIAMVRSRHWSVRIEVFSYDSNILRDFNNDSLRDFNVYVETYGKYVDYVRGDMTFRQFMNFGPKSARNCNFTP